MGQWEREINQWATLIPGIPSVPCVKQDQESKQGSSNGEGIESEKLVGLIIIRSYSYTMEKPIMQIMLRLRNLIRREKRSQSLKC